MGGLIEAFQDAVGRKVQANERGIIAHANTEFGSLAVSQGIAAVKAMLARGGALTEPGPYLIAACKNIAAGRAPGASADRPRASPTSSDLRLERRD